MGTICILLGLILLIAATLGGFLLSHMVISNSLYMTLLGLQDGTTVYLVVVGACFLVGLLICLGLVMNGMIYNRVCKNTKQLNHIAKQ